MIESMTEIAPDQAAAGAAAPDDPWRQEDNSLLEVIVALARQKWLIARITAAAMAAGLICALALPVRYAASTKLMPPQQSPSAAMVMMNQLSPAAGSPLAALAGGSLGLRNPNDLYLGLLRSRPVADSIIEKFGLMKIYKARDRIEARRRLAEATDADSDRAGFITVTVTDRDRQRAAAMANEYVAQLRILTKEVALTEAAQRRMFYDDQLKSAKESLVEAEMAFQSVEQTKGMIQPDAQARAMIESLAGLRAQVTAKTVELEAIKSYSTDRNPEVQLAESELASLQAAVARLEQKGGSGFSELGLKEVPGAGLEYLSAQHEVLYRQTLFDLLIKQEDIARLDEAKEAAIIQVVEPAVPPERRSAPDRAKIIFLFALAGFVAACLYAYAAMRIARSDELRASLHKLRRALLPRRTPKRDAAAAVQARRPGF